MAEKPSNKQFMSAARNIFNALDHIGESWSCLVGGMAARMYGVERDIEDIDIVILSPERNAKNTQQALIREFPDYFYLKRPKDKSANFMKLYYIVPRSNHAIKVDLLLSTEPAVEISPGLLNNHFEIINGLRVAPLYFVLYHKLLGWEIRVDSGEDWRVDQADSRDKSDIMRLCDIANDLDLEPRTKSHMGREYLNNFDLRVDSFINYYDGAGRRKFRKLGFDV